MIVAGVAKELVAAVHKQSDSSQFASGTVYCVARLESTDADNGKYWNGSAWTSSALTNGTAPTATHTEAGLWKYQLPAGATTGKANAVVHYTFTDHLTEASATTVCGGGEHKVMTGEPAYMQGGARQITVNVKDGGGLNLQGATVAIYDSANAALQDQKTTDASGNAVFALFDGTYKVRLVKAGFTFTVPLTLTVTADATVNYSGAAFVTSPPSAPDKCVCYDTLIDASGLPLVGAIVKAFVSVPSAVSGSQMVQREVSTTTNASGYFELQLVRNAVVILSIPAAGINGVTKTVPNAASQNVATW